MAIQNKATINRFLTAGLQIRNTLSITGLAAVIAGTLAFGQSGMLAQAQDNHWK